MDRVISIYLEKTEKILLAKINIVLNSFRNWTSLKNILSLQARVKGTKQENISFDMVIDN